MSSPALVLLKKNELANAGELRALVLHRTTGHFSLTLTPKDILMTPKDP